MGYMFGKTGLHTGDSDEAFDLFCSIQQKIANELKAAERHKANEFNTDGILNVAMILQDLQPISEGDAVHQYLVHFTTRLKKYIEKEKRNKWIDSENKRDHIKRYYSLLKNLNAKLKRINS